MPSTLLRSSFRAALEGSKRLPSFTKSYGTVSDILPTKITSSTRSAFVKALEASEPRTNWTQKEIKEIYETPLMELAFSAVCLLRALWNWEGNEDWWNMDWLNETCFLGYFTQEIPQPFSYPDVYTNEHQNRWLQRRLLILRPVFSILYRT